MIYQLFLADRHCGVLSRTVKSMLDVLVSCLETISPLSCRNETNDQCTLFSCHVCSMQSCCVFWLDLAFLLISVAMPLHVSEKQLPCIAPKFEGLMKHTESYDNHRDCI